MNGTEMMHQAGYARRGGGGAVLGGGPCGRPLDGEDQPHEARHGGRCPKAPQGPLTCPPDRVPRIHATPAPTRIPTPSEKPTRESHAIPAPTRVPPDSGTHTGDAINRLRTIFTGIGTARSDILICNVVLPFALAVGLIENDTILIAHAQSLYQTYPSLSSNRITRAMVAQLQLSSEPSGACQQQGLHYIYQQTCKEKRCDECIVGRRKL